MVVAASVFHMGVQEPQDEAIAARALDDFTGRLARAGRTRVGLLHRIRTRVAPGDLRDHVLSRRAWVAFPADALSNGSLR